MTPNDALHGVSSQILDDITETAAVQSETKMKLKLSISKVRPQVRLTARQITSFLAVKHNTERNGLFIRSLFGSIPRRNKLQEARWELISNITSILILRKGSDH